MEKREFVYALLILAVVIAALIGLNIWEAKANEVQPDEIYPMCNQHIEWTYAKVTI